MFATSGGLRIMLCTLAASVASEKGLLTNSVAGGT
jgi:hypothetical protein